MPRTRPPMHSALSMRLTDRQRAACEWLADRLGVGVSEGARMLIELGIANGGDELAQHLETAGLGPRRVESAGDLLDLGAEYETSEGDDGSVRIDMGKPRRRSRSR